MNPQDAIKKWCEDLGFKYGEAISKSGLSNEVYCISDEPNFLNVKFVWSEDKEFFEINGTIGEDKIPIKGGIYSENRGDIDCNVMTHINIRYGGKDSNLFCYIGKTIKYLPQQYLGVHAIRGKEKYEFHISKYSKQEKYGGYLDLEVI